MNLFKRSYLPYLLIMGGVVLIFLWARSRKAEGFENPSEEYNFTMYYADWCPHCKTAKPEFAKLGTIQTIGGKRVTCSAVEADANPEAAKKNNVQGYPTFHLYDASGNLVQEYKGERNIDGFQAFLDSVLNRPSSTD